MIVHYKVGSYENYVTNEEIDISSNDFSNNLRTFREKRFT